MTQQMAQNINTGFGFINSILDKKLVAKISKTEKRIFYSAIFFLIFVSIFYAYFVNQTIRNVAKRENIENEIKTIVSNISELELQYLSKKNNLTLDYAYSIGFKEVNKINYISKGTEINGLTLHGGI
ncbi:MAG: hypothetical protein AAB334_00060 [Patescibacteria group bacterium]